MLGIVSVIVTVVIFLIGFFEIKQRCYNKCLVKHLIEKKTQQNPTAKFSAPNIEEKLGIKIENARWILKSLLKSGFIKQWQPNHPGEPWYQLKKHDIDSAD